MKPTRIQRQRRKGWRMPPDTVSVCRPGPWGNPFVVGPDLRQADAAVAFLMWLKLPTMTVFLDRKQWILEHIHELRGKNLACYCPPGTPCHADTLLEMANDENTNKQTP